jgi:hypothetical protein
LKLSQKFKSASFDSAKEDVIPFLKEKRAKRDYKSLFALFSLYRCGKN